MRRIWVIALLLTAVTVTVYAQTLRHDFVQYDDDTYVIENPVVRSGLSLEGARWAFTTGYGATWQPLTWLSLMLDAELSSVKPGGFHWTNLVLHILNTLLLFGILRATTGALWRSAFTAALFSIHPLHVEPVAWVAARKDLLSTFFGLWAIAAYVTYARRGGAARYAGVAALMLASLLAKPMFVTLPMILLMMDAWPLQRLRDRASALRLVVEKLPLLGVTVGASIMAYLTQLAGGAVAGELSWMLRCANAVVSYVRYLGKTLWPVDLAVLYPHPYIAGSGAEPWAAWQVAVSTLLLLAISAAVAFAWRRGYTVFGWLWFLGTFVPVIGIVQFGEHAIADRFTYVPLIGLFVLVAWGAADVAVRCRVPERATAAAGTAVIVCLAAASWQQAAYWKDSLTLFGHAIEVTPRNSIMQYNYANTVKHGGDLDTAIRHYRLSVAINPDKGNAHYNLGNTLASLGQLDEAINHYREAARIHGNAKTHGTLVGVLMDLGELDSARVAAEDLRALDPGNTTANYALARVHQRDGELEAALREVRSGMAIDPNYLPFHLVEGEVLQAQGMIDSAANSYLRVLRGAPQLTNLAVRVGPLLVQTERWEDAIEIFRSLHETAPDWNNANYLAWSLLRSVGSHEISAADRVAQLDEAVDLAREAVGLAPPESVNYPKDTLVEALWERGSRPEAIELLRELIEENPSNTSFQERLRTYQGAIAP